MKVGIALYVFLMGKRRAKEEEEEKRTKEEEKIGVGVRAVRGRSGGGEKKKERKKNQQIKTNTRCVKLQSSIQVVYDQSAVNSARKQRIALCGCHCEAFSAHPEMGRSTSVHIL